MLLSQLFHYLFQRRNAVERTKLIQQIYDRLARLEESREETRIAEGDTTLIDGEMKELRLKLQEVMNSDCPLVQGGK